MCERHRRSRLRPGDGRDRLSTSIIGPVTLLPLDAPAWSAFVLGRPDATAFHEPFWSLLLAECYDLTGHVVAVEDRDGRIVGGIPLLERKTLLPFAPRRWTSLPFTDALPPLVDPPHAPALLAALEEARTEHDVDRIELRGPLQGARPHPAAFVAHRLALDPDPDVTEGHFHASVRRNVRTARRNGIVVRRMETEDELTGTYFGLHVGTRRRLGVPSQPRRLFELLWRRAFEPGHGFGLIAWHEGSAIAGAVFLTSRRSVMYKFGASDHASWRLRPNNLVLAEAIRIAALDGASEFDFGRSEISAEGLRSFKRGWGATELPLDYSAVGSVPAPARGAGGRVAATVLRASPTWVTRAVGSLLYRFAS